MVSGLYFTYSCAATTIQLLVHACVSRIVYQIQFGIRISLYIIDLYSSVKVTLETSSCRCEVHSNSGCVGHSISNVVTLTPESGVLTDATHSHQYWCDPHTKFLTV